MYDLNIYVTFLNRNLIKKNNNIISYQDTCLVTTQTFEQLILL